MDEVRAAKRGRLKFGGVVRNEKECGTDRRPKSTNLYRQVEISCVGCLSV